jgi:hypothetical protein
LHEIYFLYITQKSPGDAVGDAMLKRQFDLGLAGMYVTTERNTGMEMSVSHSTDCAAFMTLTSKALPRFVKLFLLRIESESDGAFIRIFLSLQISRYPRSISMGRVALFNDRLSSCYNPIGIFRFVVVALSD